MGSSPSSESDPSSRADSKEDTDTLRRSFLKGERDSNRDCNSAGERDRDQERARERERFLPTKVGLLATGITGASKYDSSSSTGIGTDVASIIGVGS